MARLMITVPLGLTLLFSCADLTRAASPASCGSADGQEQRSSRPKKTTSSRAKDAIARLQRGDALFAQKEYEAALLFFQGIIDDDPDYWLAYAHAARALHALGRTDEAIQAAEKANSLQETAMTHADLTWLYLRKGENAKALDHGRRAVEMDPTAEHTHVVLGDACLATGDLDGALAAYQRANSIRETGYAWAGIGMIQYRLKQYDQAVGSLEKAVQLDPGARSELHEVRARVALNSGDLDQAIEEMSRAIAATDNKSRKEMLRTETSDICLEKGDYAKAAEILGQKVRIGIHIAPDPNGVSVQRVVKNTPADLAGIRAGDILIQFEDQALAGVSLDTFIQEMLGKAAYGSIVRLKVDRQGQTLNLPVVAGIVPDLPRRTREALAVARPEPPNAASAAPAMAPSVQNPSAGAPSLRILSAAVNPSPVPARGDFQVDIQLMVSSPSAPSEVPVVLDCTISRQDQVLFRPPAENFSAPNGKALDIHKKLTAGPQPGTYRIRIQLTGAGLTAETTVDFDIR